MRRRIPIGAIVAGVVALAGPAAAQADSGLSSNWSGYAIHRPGVSFTSVAGAWHQPRLTCPRGHRSYSAMWVGLGGYYATPNALEQIGTELDCKRNGGVASSAWYELVPGPSHTIPRTVRPGDSLAARVTVNGRSVQLVLVNATRHWTFQQTTNVQTVDVTSAEWILEAPSACASASACSILPLAHFRGAAFTSASAQMTTGAIGSISNPAWNRTRITLTPGGRRFVVYHGSGTAAGAAKPSRLNGAGDAFVLSYKRVRPRSGFFAADLASSSLVH